MNNTTTIDTNAKEVYDAFVDLELKEMKKAIKAGLTKNRTFLRNTARKFFKSDYPNAGVIKKYKDSMLQGVRYYKKIYEAKDGDMCAIVSIGSNFKSGSGSFRIVMFEDGTNDRYTKKGYYRGKIRASNFFKKANAALDSVQGDNMVAEINKTIDKINRTKFKK